MVWSFHSSLGLGAVTCMHLDISSQSCRTLLSRRWRQKGGQIWYVSLGHNAVGREQGRETGSTYGFLAGSMPGTPWFCVMHKPRAQKETTMAGTFVAHSIAGIF